MARYIPDCEDLTGRVFNCLTVLGKCDYSMNGAMWHCRCVCGQETDARATQLRNGQKASCGCLRRKPRRAADRQNTEGSCNQ